LPEIKSKTAGPTGGFAFKSFYSKIASFFAWFRSAKSTARVPVDAKKEAQQALIIQMK